jgi:hypothetical protein
MAITITSQPSGIAFSKNIIKYIVNTNAGLKVRARLFVETTAYSDAYSFIVELEAIPNSSGDCNFYFHNIIDDNIDYHLPSFFAGQEAVQVSKRFKVDFYEYDPADLVLHDEVYSDVTGYVDIIALNDAVNYVIIQEDPPWNVTLFRLASDTQTASFAYDLADESWGSLNPTRDYDEIQIPAGVKVSIYAGDIPSVTASNVVSVLKGGQSLINTFVEISPPENLLLSAPLDTQINLSWTLPNPNYQTEIEFSTNGGSTWTALVTKDAGVTTHEHTGLTEGQTVFYRLRSKQGKNLSIYTAEISAASMSYVSDELGAEITDELGENIIIL